MSIQTELKGTPFTITISTATERYQDLGAKEDHFAEMTDRYGDINQALSCMINDCGFILPSSLQVDLFDGE